MPDPNPETHEPTLGIRTLTTQDGQTRYQARVHCRLSHKQYTQRFTNLAEAIQWRQKVVTLLESGMDPTAISRKHKRKTESLKRTPPTPSESALESATPPPATIRESIQNFIKHRSSTTPIPANRLTDYLRVLDDFGDYPVQDLRNEDLVSYIALMRKTPLKRYTKNKKNKSLGGSSESTTYKDASIRKFIYALKVALQWNAKNRGIQFNPHLFSFGQSEMPAAWDENRQRRLRPGEESKL